MNGTESSSVGIQFTGTFVLPHQVEVPFHSSNERSILRECGLSLVIRHIWFFDEKIASPESYFRRGSTKAPRHGSIFSLNLKPILG